MEGLLRELNLSNLIIEKFNEERIDVDTILGGDRSTRLHLHHHYFVYSLVLFLILVLFT